MKKKIENPKVFISYAWGNKEYEDEVISFASQLVSDGIDVVLDKWDLTEGNDTYAFMEKCATDDSITNVLMLLDPVYAKRADEHAGGVGTETQIISAKLYKEVSQDKFIPVIMRRDDNNGICKPIYLQGRLHFDLSKPDEYDETYQRLVKTLYGEEIYNKPELGKKPNWVEKTTHITPKRMLDYNSLKGSQPGEVKHEQFVSFLADIKTRLQVFATVNDETKLNGNEYIALYDDSEEIRNDYLFLLGNMHYVEGGHKCIAEFLEETRNLIDQPLANSSNIIKIRIHELFLYTMANYIKSKDYNTAGYTLGRTYLNHLQRGPGADSLGFQMFYSGSYHQQLEKAIRGRDSKNYFTGVGQHWMETIANDFCTKEQFVLADLICYNYSIYGKDYNCDWKWFPITYVYDNEHNSSLGGIGKRLISKEFVQEVLPLFGFDSVERFVEKMHLVENNQKELKNNCGYSGCFESPFILGDFVKAETVATLN